MISRRLERPEGVMLSSPGLTLVEVAVIKPLSIGREVKDAVGMLLLDANQGREIKHSCIIRHCHL